MKQINLVDCLKKVTIIPIAFSLLIACEKESSSSIKEANVATIESDLALVKSIVGKRGNLFVMYSTDPNGKINNESGKSANSLSSNIRTIEIKDFSKIFESLTSDSIFATGIMVKKQGDSLQLRSNAIKVNDERADDGPGPAGLYRFTFGPSSGNNPSFFSNLNLSFNSNSDGSINGTPSLYFSGIQLFGWQSQNTSLVSFNPSTFVSTFAVTGVATFGIQMGSGTTLGWGSNITFYISVNMDEFATKPVSIYTYK